jgi:hypothetical protein
VKRLLLVLLIVGSARVRAGDLAISSVTSEGFTVGGKAHEWREDPALSASVLEATARSDADRRRLARFALEERLFAVARKEIAALGKDPAALDEARIAGAAPFRSGFTLAGGVLRVPLGARDLEATSFLGPLLGKLVPRRVLTWSVRPPVGASLEEEKGALVLRGQAPRARGRTLALVPGSELALEHEGFPSDSGYFGFDLVDADEAPLAALDAIGAGERKVELVLASGRGETLDHVVTKPLAKTARLRLVAGTPCRLLSDGKEVARLEKTFAHQGLACPVLGVAVGGQARDGRFGRLVLEATPDPAWLERATARLRFVVGDELGRVLGGEEPAFARRTLDHFELATDLGPASLDAFARDLERAFAGYEHDFGKARDAAKTRVVVFGTDDAYRQCLDSLGRGEEWCLGGFFDPGRNTITMKVDEGSPRARLAHEAFHAFAARALPDLPAWLSEGLAEREGQRFAGTPLSHFRRPLEEASRQPRDWTALLSASNEGFHDRGARASGERSVREKRSYVLAWSICELAARKPSGAASRLVARALEAAKEHAHLDVDELDSKQVDEEWLGFVKEALGR